MANQPGQERERWQSAQGQPTRKDNVHPSTAPGDGHCRGNLPQHKHGTSRRGGARTGPPWRRPQEPIADYHTLPRRGPQAEVLDQGARPGPPAARDTGRARPSLCERLGYHVLLQPMEPNPNRAIFPRGAGIYFPSRWLDAALAAVVTVVIETIAPSVTNAANTTSLIRELRWRFSILVRWFMSSSLARAPYKTETIEGPSYSN